MIYSRNLILETFSFKEKKKKYSKNIWSFGNLRNALFISQFLIVPCKYIYGQTPSPFLKLLLWILTAVLLFPSHLLFPFFFPPPESWRHRGRYQEVLQCRRTRLLQISSTRYIAVKLFFLLLFRVTEGKVTLKYPQGKRKLVRVIERLEISSIK